MNAEGIAREWVEREPKISLAEAKRRVETFKSILVDAIVSEGDVVLPGLGTFVVVVRAARKGINPQTLEPIDIPEKGGIKFKPAAALKRAIA